MDLRCVNRREFMALIRIIIAILCIWNFNLMGFYSWYTFDVNIFQHRCCLMALAAHNIFGTLGTWLWRSNNVWSRMYGRIVTILVNVTLMILLFCTYSKYVKHYDYMLYGYFDANELLMSEDEAINQNLELLHITSMLLSVICFVEAYMVYAHLINTLKKRNSDHNASDKK